MVGYYHKKRNKMHPFKIIIQGVYKTGEGIFTEKHGRGTSRMNKNKLKGKIREQGFTYQKLAKKIGIGLTSMNYKINGKYLFNHEEMIKLKEALKLSDN